MFPIGFDTWARGITRVDVRGVRRDAAQMCRCHGQVHDGGNCWVNDQRALIHVCVLA